MQVLSFYKPKTPSSGPPSVEEMEKMGAFMAEMAGKGHLIAGGGMMAGAAVVNVSLSNGKLDVRDGTGLIPPGFGGFGLLQAGSKEEMVDIIRQFLEIAGDGECVVHPLMGGPPEPA